MDEDASRMTAKSTGDSGRSGSEGTVRGGVIDSRHLYWLGQDPASAWPWPTALLPEVIE
jgi:hypothetical protein